MTRSRCSARYRLQLQNAKHLSAVYADCLKQEKECASAELKVEVEGVGRWEDVESERQPPK